MTKSQLGEAIGLTIGRMVRALIDGFAVALGLGIGMWCFFTIWSALQ